ncbi:glycosyltransferase family 4 protein [Salisaeta longa]|uniref:glycosyltransferase family 4 protein n=1 Tax=Salisaeta longa TaxID=503170 RepID=UPI00048A6162|nr:glycosyltransferase family 4 protein [Salisaeta longa]
MKTVVYSKPFFPLMGGLERNTLSLCLALEELGHSPHLFTETAQAQEDTYSFPVTRSTSVLELYKLLGEADLLIVNGNVSLRAIVPAIIRGIPYAVIYHNYEGYARRGSGPRTRIENWIREQVARNSAANIFTSTYGKQHADVPESRSHVVFNPVDREMEPLYEDIHQSERNAKQPLLFAGRLIAGKGIFVLMDAIEMIPQELRPPIMFAGEGEDQGTLEKRAREIDGDIELAGRLNSEQLVEAYHQARALVVPSTTHKEGNPLVIAESIYAGTPVIASDQPPMIESVGKAGQIVEQGDAKALVSAIRSLYENESIYRETLQHTEERRAKFSFAHYKQRIRAIISTLD